MSIKFKVRNLLFDTPTYALVLLGASFAVDIANAKSASARGAFPAQDQSKQLEDFVTTYTNVYYTLGACDGFVPPETEAPFDPFGPMLSKWPDSFKQQMADTREEGRLESLRLARRNKFTFEERAKLCASMVDDAVADMNRMRAQYLPSTP